VEPIAPPKNATLPASRPQTSALPLSAVNGPSNDQLEQKWVPSPRGGPPSVEGDGLETGPLRFKIGEALKQLGGARRNPDTALEPEHRLLSDRALVVAFKAKRDFETRHSVSGPESIAA
jgi:hypothetical protein